MPALLFGLLFVLLLCSPAPAYLQENNRGVELLEQGRFQESLALLKEAQQRQPYDEVVKRNLQMAYLMAGRELLQQQSFAAAVELLDEAQQFDDSQREYWTMRGYAFLRLKRYDEAEVELLESLGMGEPNADIYHMLGKIYYNTDRMFEARDALENADFYAPENQSVKQMLAKVRRELAVEKEMEKEYGGHFVITFEGGENAGLGDEVLEVLEDAYNWTGSKLDHYPEQRVTVILYSRRQFSELTDSPDWAGGLYDGKIRLPVGGISRVDTRVQALLYHEYMHVVVRDMVRKTVPVWLNEGLAEVAERHISAAPLLILPKAREQEKLIPLAALEHSFARFSGMQVALAYEQSFAVVSYLIDRFGWYNIRELLLSLDAGNSFFAAVEAVLGIYDMSYPSLQRRWLEDG